ncbi:hypothetical protein MKK75_08005 [Methylobacterium sp. J-030]|uniref:hypothetical protein n=1 Tax=Methylobacterium sp. J-030 TaxID=2836627 RepID=UPI001FBC0E3A|nr:hypothetical protein [Methylobacterium sp. J-030]MCJ2068746.1 hypothetical protein [Methylobacterium sp. J-030]
MTHDELVDDISIRAMMENNLKFYLDRSMRIIQIVTAFVAVSVAGFQVSAYAGNARGFTYAPKPDDTPLRIKCRSEAAAMISGGKGSTQYAEYNRQLRREHVKKCMAGG